MHRQATLWFVPAPGITRGTASRPPNEVDTQDPAALFGTGLGLGGVFALLHSGHAAGDFWVQTSACAAAKGRDGWEGRRACAIHVATLTATQCLVLAAGALAVGERLNPRRVAMGLAVNAASHYFADRRTPLRRLAERVGIGEFYGLGQPRPGRDDNPGLGTGAYALDQAWHIGWLAVAAAIIARKS